MHAVCSADTIVHVRYVAAAMVLAALYGAYGYFLSRPIEHDPGVIAADEPQQDALAGAAALEQDGFELMPRASFSAEVRVLARENYSLGPLADVSPIDIAVGWGRMSDSAVLADLEISQGNRFYYWHYDGAEPPIPRAEIESHSANWHLVPETRDVLRTLRHIRVGDVVRLEGELVDIKRADLGEFRTSLKRTDTGAGACEVILVHTASWEER